MPRWVRRYLRSSTIKQHLFIALGLGFFLRLLSAYFVYGPQALDDYKHGVYPAYQFFAGLEMDLPDYRSRLLVWMLGGFIHIGSWFGCDSALAQVRVMYIGLAVVSLLGILGTYFFVRGYRSHLFPPLALYMAAAYPLIPFVSTRAFGEAVAMSFVMLGFGILESARRAHSRTLGVWVAGFLFLGIATLFRFHVGILFVVYGGALLYLRVWSGVIGGLVAGVLSVGAQAAVDFYSGKPFFGTLLSYLAENEGGAVQYGVSPWYNTWLLALALALVPFSLVFVRGLKGLWREHWPWLLAFLAYVTAHSLVPHKEERFLYPIVGLELWALAWLWAGSALSRLSRKIFAPAYCVLSILILFIVCFVNTQEGEIEPPAYAESLYRQVIYLDHESLFGMSRIRFYFLRPPSFLEKVEREGFNAHKIDEELEDHPQHRAVVLLTSVPLVRDQLRALEGIHTIYSRCDEMRTSGSLIDRLIYALNPKHNERRRPTWYLVCERI